jgi:aromatic ring hydroxylase
MPIETGLDYLNSLRDGREVWLAGSRVLDVTEHPAFQGCLASIAAVYDKQHDPSCSDLLTMQSPSTGERVSLAYLIPRSAEDLLRRRKMIEYLAGLNGGMMGRLPDYVPLILLGLLAQKELLARYERAWAGNVEGYFEQCRENDSCLSHSFADPQIDRSKPSEQLNFLRIVSRDETGLTVRGSKTVATLAPFANEYLVLTPPRAGISPEQVILFSVPIATPGLRFICREPFGRENSSDHPLSSRFDEMDATAIFDDVRIPRERIFLSENVEALRTIWRALNSWAYYHILIRMAVKAEVFLGTAALITEQIGTKDFQNVQEELANIARYAETIKAFLRAAEADAVIIRGSGVAMPNPKSLMVGHMYAVENYPNLHRSLIELGGQGVLMTPGFADYGNEELRDSIDGIFAGSNSQTEDRIKLFKLAWDMACGSFAARQLLFELFNGRNLTRNRLDFLRSFDLSPFRERARRLAGLPIPAQSEKGDSPTERRPFS